MEKMVKITMTIPESALLTIKGFAEMKKFDFSCEYISNQEILEKIFNEIDNRLCHSNFYVENHNELYNTVCITINHPKKGIRVGIAKCNPADNYAFNIGYCLALTRACGWEDLEEKLLSVL